MIVRTYATRCDQCGTENQPYDTEQDAVAHAVMGGWSAYPLLCRRCNATPPAVGDEYTHRESGQRVTVTRAWTAGNGRPSVAYDWTDDKPGQAFSACPVDVFRNVYKRSNRA